MGVYNNTGQQRDTVKGRHTGKQLHTLGLFIKREKSYKTFDCRRALGGKKSKQPWRHQIKCSILRRQYCSTQIQGGKSGKQTVIQVFTSTLLSTTKGLRIPVVYILADIICTPFCLLLNKTVSHRQRKQTTVIYLYACVLSSHSVLVALSL